MKFLVDFYQLGMYGYIWNLPFQLVTQRRGCQTLTEHSNNIVG